jgi:endonuclease/exonuclease/phosphatase family metal-dependent hydrolase
MNPSKFTKQLKNVAALAQKHDPDLIYVGFQELFELKMKLASVMNYFNVEEIIQDWKSLLGEAFPAHRLVFDDTLVALQSFLLVRVAMKSSILSIDSRHVKLGIMNMGNKGAIKLTLNFNGYVTDIFNCHLTAGESNENHMGRVKDLQTIIGRGDDKGNVPHCSFLLGDFNFKVRSEISEVYKTIRSTKEPFKALRNSEEWAVVNKELPESAAFKEERVLFPPTFKYVSGEAKLDVDSGRTPSWCDRIFSSAKKVANFRIVDYHALPLYVSDHLPVYLVADVNKHNPEEKG